MGVETGAAEEIKDQERTRYGQPEDLSNLSMSRHFNATRDIDWEAPEMQIDPDHPGFDFSHLEEDPLLETEWFKNLDEKTRCNLGLTFYCHHFRLAIDFEHGAQTGMLRLAEFADRQSDEYRYILHEMAEEAQHTLMFHLFITKAGLTPPGTPKLGLLMYRMVAKWARVFPEAFWMWAFGCEDTGDNYLGVNIKDRNKIHPLAWRVIKIHMTEEARHITFAKIFVMRRIKNLGFMKKWHLMIFSMFVAWALDLEMRSVSARIAGLYGAPREVQKKMTVSPRAYRLSQRCLKGYVEYCQEVGLINAANRWLWRFFGLLPAKKST